MAKRFFGLELSHQGARLAVLTYDAGQLQRLQLLHSQHSEAAEQLRELSNQLQTVFTIHDRWAAVLPAGQAYVRELEFPFQDAKKIAAAVPLALNAQIPIPVENCATAAAIGPAPDNTAGRTIAAAIPRATLENLLAAAELVGIPLRTVDLAPFALVTGLAEQLSEGILIVAGDTELTISHLQRGKLADYRLLPMAAAQDERTRATLLVRDIPALLAGFSATEPAPPIYLTGAGASEALAGQLAEQGLQVEQLSLNLAGEAVPPAFVPAVATALRARSEKTTTSFNFRQGSYALKGEWQKLKRSLITSVCLGIVLVLLLVGAGLVNYRAKTTRVDRLQQQMVDIYQQTFPASTTIVDIPLQMQSAIGGLQERSRLLGSTRAGALETLKTVSQLPDELSMDVQEFNYSPEEVRISARTDSFDTVNRINEQLAGSSLFAEVQVADAKLTLQNDRIDFRLIMTLAPGGSAP
jgi:general secretion pathway protein L